MKISVTGLEAIDDVTVVMQLAICDDQETEEPKTVSLLGASSVLKAGAGEVQADSTIDLAPLLLAALAYQAAQIAVLAEATGVSLMEEAEPEG